MMEKNSEKKAAGLCN